MSRFLSTAILRLVLAAVSFSWLPVPARAQGASVELLCPPDGVDAGSDFAVEVRINTGSQVLGAYTVAINYDPAVFSVSGVTGGRTEQFSLLPTVNPADFLTGRTRISAFNTASVTEPTGVASVSEVGISMLGTIDTPASIEVEVTTLADINGARIEEVTTEPCTVSFANGTPAPTLTEVVSSPTPSPVSTSTSPPATFSSPPSATATATPTRTPTETGDITPSPRTIPCPGDCNSDETVTADELVLGVNIVLKRLPIDECTPLDWIADGEVNVDEVVTAVRMALYGCGARSSPPPRL